MFQRKIFSANLTSFSNKLENTSRQKFTANYCEYSILQVTVLSYSISDACIVMPYIVVRYFAVCDTRTHYKSRFFLLYKRHRNIALGYHVQCTMYIV